MQFLPLFMQLTLEISFLDLIVAQKSVAPTKYRQIL